MPISCAEAHRSGVLGKSITEARSRLRNCDLCPRLCGVDRLAGEKGYCRTLKKAVVASYGPHFGEERPLSGSGGSGTIFFSHCNLYCAFCQNHEVSHGGQGTPVNAEELAAIMLSLQAEGCHNINLVSPSHVVAQILEALPYAIEGGLCIPLVFNTGGYDRVSTLRSLEGIIDIYMPDFKFWSAGWADTLCKAPDYPVVARRALIEMRRQVGDLTIDEKGIARRGLLVRHLVMPGAVEESKAILGFIAREISAKTYVNIMNQYYPCGDIPAGLELGRCITDEEFREAVKSATALGLTRLDDRHRHWVDIEL